MQGVAQEQQENDELREKSKETLLIHIRQFSTEEMELHFIRPLAIARGLLPTVFDFSKGAYLSYSESLRALDFDGNELLASAIDEMGFVKGSVPKAKCPTDSLPTCKYMALFNADPSFDGLRQTFFDGTEDICIANLSMLKNIIETREVPLSLLQHAWEFYRVMDAYHKTPRPLSEPPNFASRVWPAYLAYIKS